MQVDPILKMEGFIKPGDNSEQVTKEREETFSEVFKPPDTLDQPCDVVLVVEDGKEFKAHRKVLSEASPFFEKLLNSDMKESKEGIVRLEMCNEFVMAATLEFIYTGHTKTLSLSEDNTRDLIFMADYLFLQKLKTLAEGGSAQKLNTSNCISTYYFSERYQLDELLSKTKKYILANFSAVYAAHGEAVLNMSSKEVEMWILSDELDVSAEEDVFKFILEWIDHDKSERKKYFAELFRQVRLVYVLRDVLISDVVTNDFVKENESCLDLVKDAIHLIDSQEFEDLPVPPRKSLETPVIVALTIDGILCYFPDEDKWWRCGEQSIWTIKDHRFFPCYGKLYAFRKVFGVPWWSCKLNTVESYSLYSNRWRELAFLEKNRELQQIFVKNEDEMYALLLERSTDPNLFILSKYKPKSNSWEDLVSFDSFEIRQAARQAVCIVAKDDFIYFVGGTKRLVDSSNFVTVSDVDRYDLSKNKWDKVADIQAARKGAVGVVVKGKIFVVGGVCHGKRLPRACQCELYDEASNEWQFIKCFNMRPEVFKSLLVIDDELYAAGSTVCESDVWRNRNCEQRHLRLECYNLEKNEWEIKSEIAIHVESPVTEAKACSVKIFKRFFGLCQPVETSPPLECLSENTNSSRFSDFLLYWSRHTNNNVLCD